MISDSEHPLLIPNFCREWANQTMDCMIGSFPCTLIRDLKGEPSHSVPRTEWNRLASSRILP